MVEGSEKYLEILASLNSNSKDGRGVNDHILVIDGLNSLIRSFSAVKTVNPKGYHIGGLTGFLKSMAYVMRMFKPTRIIVAWDGKGGGQNRRNLNSNYKAQRLHSSVIHWDMYDSKDEEMQSIRDQAERLLDYLACLPVTFVKIDKLEADDIIAYISQSAAERGHKVTIVSSDKDFLQLVTDNISVHNPSGKKITYDYSTTMLHLGVLPENYAIVKALQGDKSDNLIGVRGVGIKKLIKLFPELVTQKCTLQDIYDTCAKNLGTKQPYATILNDWNRVELNFKLMDLHETVLDESEIQLLNRQMRIPVPKVNVGLFLTLLDQDCIEGLTKNTETWLSSFRYLENFKKSSKNT